VADDRTPRNRAWPRCTWRSVRARTTIASTAVVAAALLAAGFSVLTALHRHLVDGASLQAEVTAREVAAQVAAGTALSSLDLPGTQNQPVQVVSPEGRVLAAGRTLRGTPPFADFARAPRKTFPVRRGNHRHDHHDDHHDDSDIPPRGFATTTARFKNVQMPDGNEEHEFRVAAVFATTRRGHTVTVYAGASLNTDRQAVAGVRRVMLIGLPLLLAVAAGTTWLVTRRALRPVEGIRAELAEIMKGDLSRRVPQPPSHDEVAALATTTNATLAALEEAVARQRRFVADVSHELRSPIASLRTQLEVARAHPQLLEIDGLIDDTLRLEHLAADLLFLARLDAGEKQRTEPLDLAALVRRELVHRVADRVPVETAIPDEPMMVTANRTQLIRILRNLVDNAQRHAASAVRVALHHRQGHGMVLDVTDDGPGVPAADRERIFERFVRLDDARSRDAGGAGLGLAIVRDLVHRHGGRIEVGDADTGGARFTVTLATAG
jgi:signal transduction histidine kinase